MPRSFHPFGHRRLWWLAWVLVGAAILGAWLALPRPGARVLILSGTMESRGQNLGAGMEWLLRDHLEGVAGATVSHEDQLPGAEELQRLPPDAWVLRFQGRRVGEDLALVTEWNTVARLLRAQPWTLETPPAGPPAEVLGELVQRWPLGHPYPVSQWLVPRDQARFWSLLETLAIQDDRVATANLAATQQLADAEPQCATAWALLGDHLYRSLWVRPEAAGVGLNSQTYQAFQRAQQLVPGHPRAAFLGALMLTDTGNQQLAIQSLQAALKLRPAVPDLYLGLAYAARTAGLLEGARKALERRRQLLGPSSHASAWLVETTYLYQGDLKAFDLNLRELRSIRLDATVLFYQGYLALLQQNREEALGFFKSGSSATLTPAPFRDLCRAYLAYLEGRPAEGLAVLRALDDLRGKLRIPDGEWTFKEAEAYALLGDTGHAMDAASRAFSQGFSCAVWYEGSPFLTRARTHPRWPTLLRNVRERQAVLAGTFPPSAFKP